MEVRINNHGSNSLSTKVFFSDEKGFEVASVITIPGHQKPGMPFDSSSYSFTRDYLITTEEELAKTKDEGCFYFAMVQRFPEANLFISNEMNAGVFKGGRNWNWKDE